MYIHSIKPSGGAGFRLLLFLLVFMLPLIAYVVNHVNSGSFISPDIPEHPHATTPHRGSDATPCAELQEEEFDEAIIPKAFHHFYPVFEPPQPFRFENPAYRPIATATLFPPGEIRITVPEFPVLRC